LRQIALQDAGIARVQRNFYLFDAEFGFMRIRLQSWFPFQIQV
jgi:hypothetical protein